MPRGDGTGPMGRGPMTGRGAGFCSWIGGGASYPAGAPSPGLGYGLGRGFRGGGRGWGNRFFARGFWGWLRPAGYSAPYQGPDPDVEKQMLKRETDVLKTELSYLQKRLDELERIRIETKPAGSFQSWVQVSRGCKGNASGGDSE